MLDLDVLNEEEDDEQQALGSYGDIGVDVRVSWGGCRHMARPKEECKEMRGKSEDVKKSM